MMAAEAEGDDKTWAINQLRQEFGEEFDAGPTPRFDMRTNSVPSFDPMDAAIKRRAAQGPPSTLLQAAQSPRVEAGLRGFAQGASGMYSDEMAGSSGAYGVGGFGLPGLSLSGVRDAAIARERAGDPTGTKTYEAVRNEERGSNATVAEANPEAYYPFMVGGAMMMPGPKGAPKGSGFGTRLGASAGGGFVTGTATGIGASDKEDPGEIAQDALASGALAGTMGAAGTTLAAPFGAAWRRLGRSAPQRIANEAAEGPTQMTTATARKQLKSAQEGLAEEVISGPRGAEVRAALKGPAKDAPAKMQPRLDELGQQREAAYTAFEEAGKGALDPNAYRAGLEAAAKSARKPSERKALQKLVGMYDEWADDLTADGSPLTLRDVRDFTTDIQGLAKEAIGSINEHTASRLKNKMAAVASKQMDDMLSAAAEGDEVLQGAAASLRESNKGTAPLLTAKTALKRRAEKEASEGSGFRRLTRQGAIPTLMAGVGAGAADEDESKVENALKYAGAGYALSKGLPYLGGKLDDLITSGAIYAARNPNSAIPGVLASGTRPFVPPLSLDIMDALMKRREQERK